MTSERALAIICDINARRRCRLLCLWGLKSRQLRFVRVKGGDFVAPLFLGLSGWRVLVDGEMAVTTEPDWIDPDAPGSQGGVLLEFKWSINFGCRPRALQECIDLPTAGRMIDEPLENDAALLFDGEFEFPVGRAGRLAAACLDSGFHRYHSKDVVAWWMDDEGLVFLIREYRHGSERGKVMNGCASLDECSEAGFEIGASGIFLEPVVGCVGFREVRERDREDRGHGFDR